MSGPRDAEVRATPEGGKSPSAPLLEEMLAGTLGLVLCVSVILFLVQPALAGRWITVILSVSAVAGIAYLIGRLGYRRLASASYISALIFGTTRLASTAGGIHSPAMLAYPIMVMIAGMLLGDAAALLAGIACSLAGLWLALAEIGGRLPASLVTHTPISLWALNSAWTFFLVGLQRIGNHIMRRSLVKAESELIERQKVERQLLDTSESLRQALQVAAKSEAEFRAIFENAAIGVVLVDRSGQLTLCNPALARFIGYTAEEIVGSSRTAITHPADLDLTAEFWREIWSSDSPPSQMERRFIRKDGATVWGRITASLIGNRDAAAAMVMGIVEDITARKRAEEERAAMEAQFRQAQKMEAVGQLAGGVAHDFNNLLLVINGYAATLLGTLPPGDPSRPMIEQMRQAGERAASLTNQLLAFSRKRVIESRVIDVNELIANLEKMLLQLTRAGTKLELRLDLATGRVETDPALLEQALINVVLNARDAMPSGGKITIETQTVDLEAPLGRYALLKVSDTGCGMDERVREHLFEPFFTTKPAGQGTGLGLTMVYGFVKQSGGHIRVESRPGEGSSIFLYLPVIAEESAPGRTNAIEGHETVLVVEDEDGVRSLVKLVLEARGYKVLEAPGGPAAIEIARRYRQPVHLLLVDVVMPDMNGLDVERALRPLHPEMKVLFFSGYTDDEVVRHGVLKASMHFLQKPFTPARLAAKVREVLDSQSHA